MLDLADGGHSSGITVSVDPASVAGLRSVGPTAFLGWTSAAAVIFPNLDEGTLLTGRADPAGIVDELLKSYPIVALKLGREGCAVAARGDEQLHVPAAWDGPTDSTGAGDAFCAGFLAEWVRGSDPSTCASGAMDAAAEAVRLPGARPPARRA